MARVPYAPAANPGSDHPLGLVCRVLETLGIDKEATQ